MNIKRFFLPPNLPIAEMEALCPRVERLEKMFFFISTINLRRYTDRSLKENCFVPMKSEILARFLGDRKEVAAIKRDLLSLGIIETDGEYTVGKKALGFRLTEKYGMQKMQAKAPRKVKNIRFEWETPDGKGIDESQLDENELFLLGCLQRVTIPNKAAAMMFIERRYAEAMDEINLKRQATTHASTLTKLKNEEISALNVRNFAFMAIYSFTDGNLFWASDKKTGRIFNNVANAPKVLRKYLQIDGRSLADIDIKSSQPTLFYSLYPDKASAEAERYKALIESGLFYEFFAAKLECTRDQFKKRYMPFAYGRNQEEAKENKICKVFRTEFPELYAIMKQIKSEEHSAFAILLQKKEADLMIKTVVPLCKARGIPVITIHDSAMTFPEFADEVAEMIRTKCKELYGITANVTGASNAALAI